MSRIKNSNFYVVNGWMVNDLKLTGRELQVYAIIYGFTQDDETEFSGSLNYIAEWLGTNSRHTVLRAINSLLEKGLITKRQVISKDTTTNYYKTVWPYPSIDSVEIAQGGSAETAQGGSAKTTQGGVSKRHGVSVETAQGASVETAQGASAETAHNIYISNNISNNIDNLLVKKEKKEEKNNPVPYQKIKDLYNDICKSFSRVITISATRKKAIAARWKEYGENIEVFETLFKMAEESNFLRGENERHWTATFDWLMKSANMTKVLEGNYKNKGSVKYGSGTNPAGPTRAVTTAELEDKLRKEGSFKGYPDFDKMFGGKGGTENGSNGEIA